MNRFVAWFGQRKKDRAASEAGAEFIEGITRVIDTFLETRGKELEDGYLAVLKGQLESGAAEVSGAAEASGEAVAEADLVHLKEAVAEADLVNFGEHLQGSKASLKSEINLLLAPWDDTIDAANLRDQVDVLSLALINEVFDAIFIFGRAMVSVHIEKLKDED